MIDVEPTRVAGALEMLAKNKINGSRDLSFTYALPVWIHWHWDLCYGEGYVVHVFKGGSLLGILWLVTSNFHG